MAANLLDHEQITIFREPTENTAGYAIGIHLRCKCVTEQPADHHCRISELYAIIPIKDKRSYIWCLASTDNTRNEMSDDKSLWKKISEKTSGIHS